MKRNLVAFYECVCVCVVVGGGGGVCMCLSMYLILVTFSPDCLENQIMK